jgi:DNA-binding transcriptional regulator YiaG
MTLLDTVRAAHRLPKPAMARLIRSEAGVSQARLAAEVGVHRVTLARWEAGVSRPQSAALRARYASLLADMQELTA